MNDFYKAIEDDIAEEANDNIKYLELAKIAPTEKARKILTDIAHEETTHHNYLKEILADRVSSNKGEKNNYDSRTQQYEDNELDYPSDIENVGVDPDVLEVSDKK